jgi:hypothetical protein
VPAPVLRLRCPPATEWTADSAIGLLSKATRLLGRLGAAAARAGFGARLARLARRKGDEAGQRELRARA